MKKDLTIPFAFSQGSFWMSFCIAISLSVLYLQGVGYNNTHLGIIMAFGNLLGVIIATALSTLIDKGAGLPVRRVVPLILFFQAVFIILLIINPVRSIFHAVTYIIYVGFSVSVNSMNLKLYSDIEYQGLRINYGISRGIGSLSFVLLSFVLGFFLESVEVTVLPFIGLFLTLLQGIAHLILCRSYSPSKNKKERADEKSALSLSSFLMKHKSFSLLLFGTAVIFLGHNLVTNFIINVTRNVGGDANTMSFINAFMALTEIPVMFFYSKLQNRFKSGTLLNASFIFFFVKAVALFLAFNVPTLFFAFFFQAPSFALYTSAIVIYVNKTIDHEDSAKAQSLAYNMTTVGAIIASVIGGILYDNYSVNAVLFITVLVCAIGGFFSILSTHSGSDSSKPA